MRPFYLGNPNSSGVFVVDLKRDQFIDGVSLYKFEPFKGDEEKAHFSLHNTPNVYQRITENWDTLVLQVCECDNYPEKRIDGIETVTKGVAELRPSGNWRMVQKAKVKYTESDAPSWYKALEKDSHSLDQLSQPIDDEERDNGPEVLVHPIEAESVDDTSEVSVLKSPEPKDTTSTPQPVCPGDEIAKHKKAGISDIDISGEKKSASTKSPPIATIVIIALVFCAIIIYFLARPSVETLFSKGKEQFETQNFTEAAAYFSKAIKRNSGNAEVRGWRGRAYFELKNYESAIADFKEAARLAPNVAEYHHRLGETYSGMKNYENAVTAYTRAIQLDPKNANYYFSRAGANSEKKAYMSAVDDFTQAIRLDPSDARYYNSRGGDYRNMGDYDRAYVDHSEAIRLNPSDAKYHNNRGVAQVLRKKYAEAIPDFSEAIRLAPDNARYYNNRGDAYVLTKDIVSAEADYCMAAKLDGGNATYRGNCDKMGKRTTDSRDGQKYQAVKIGDKIWLAQNMNYRPQTGKSWCYDDNGSNCDKYGRLYDWNTAKTACLSGWHLPSRREWKDLVAAVGASSVAGKKLKVASPEWNGTDEYKFSARPGGYRNNDGSFSAVGTDGSWWTATESGSHNAYLQYMSSDYGNVLEMEYDKGNGFSARCVMDAR